MSMELPYVSSVKLDCALNAWESRCTNMLINYQIWPLIMSKARLNKGAFALVIATSKKPINQECSRLKNLSTKMDKIKRNGNACYVKSSARQEIFI